MSVKICSTIIEGGWRNFPKDCQGALGPQKPMFLFCGETSSKEGRGLILMDFFRQKTNLSYDRKGLFCYCEENWSTSFDHTKNVPTVCFISKWLL